MHHRLDRLTHRGLLNAPVVAAASPCLLPARPAAALPCAAACFKTQARLETLEGV